MSVAATAGGQAALEDITGGTAGDWLVIGWFTPDYRPLAEEFAANLAKHGAPFHLWARPKLAKGWNTQQKPSVVLQAMDAYPSKTLVLMDVDCTVKGDKAPVAQVAGDVGINLKARQVRRWGRWQRRLAIAASSRVVVFRPTEGARAFAKEWRRLCETAHYGGDETSMAWAYLVRSDVPYSFLDPLYAGREIAGALVTGGHVIVHESAHLKASPWSFKETLKAIERRYLRTGRTKREAQARLG
jgi:hypothetical protein